MNNLIDFEKKIDIEFNNKKLLEQVFIHRSYINEHRGLGLSHNERLEFLGDAVLELAVTEYIYSSCDQPEGEMTSWRSALVKGESLSLEAKKLGIDKYLHVSRGEAKNIGKARDLILANTFEALIGAIYLDRGYKEAKKFIDKYINYRLNEIISSTEYIDAKSRLQEISQERYSITPSYETISETGPDHNKNFTVVVKISDEVIAEGEGNSKQKAQISAASKALQTKKFI